MTEEQRHMVQLSYALGLAIGALEMLAQTGDFNPDGLMNILEQIKGIATLPFLISLDDHANPPR